MAGLYIHIPFCRNKCAYCDFYSTPDVKWMEQYVNALLVELSLRKTEIAEPFTTLYLGGGTPSLLSDMMLAKLIAGIDSRIGMHNMQEVTIEANPEDIDLQKISFFKSLGINRISIGIQSFYDNELESVARKHSATDAIKALDALSESGINYNADLIYGLPDQDTNAWKNNLAKLLDYAPPHFSAYLLSYEPGTKLYARMIKGDVAETSEAVAHEMYAALCEKASEAGYTHYEISNFAKPGRKAVHNSLYWHYVPYLGIGAAAHSFDGFTRRANPGNVKMYVKSLLSGSVVCRAENETITDRFNDYIITSLRTIDGFDTRLAESCFSESLVGRFRNGACCLLDGGTLEISPSGNYVIPEKSWLTSDAVLRDLILD